MNATLARTDLHALYAALVDAAAATHHVLGDNYGQAGRDQRAASAHAGCAFPAGSPEAAALGVVLAAIGGAVSEMRERRTTQTADRITGAS